MIDGGGRGGEDHQRDREDIYTHIHACMLVGDACGVGSDAKLLLYEQQRA